MAIATTEQIIADVKKVLPIYNASFYDDELLVLVNGAISKIKSEGIDNVFEYQSPLYYDYVTCIRYQVAMDMDMDVDVERLNLQYLARVNTLRCTLNQ